jgi:hypothetical protein
VHVSWLGVARRLGQLSRWRACRLLFRGSPGSRGMRSDTAFVARHPSFFRGELVCPPLFVGRFPPLARQVTNNRGVHTGKASAAPGSLADGCSVVRCVKGRHGWPRSGFRRWRGSARQRKRWASTPRCESMRICCGRPPEASRVRTHRLDSGRYWARGHPGSDELGLVLGGERVVGGWCADLWETESARNGPVTPPLRLPSSPGKEGRA